MWPVRDIVDTTTAAVALVLGFFATPHVLFQTWALFRPNGETAKALRPTTIVQTTVTRDPSKPTARQVKKDRTQRLIAKDLHRLVLQGRGRAEVDDRMVELLETLVMEQRARAPRNFSAAATFNFDY
ncbi:hypothetical protein VC83_08375 [Pseudogymnoascus destructans]|uniref:Uncharacterized protein n=2 Tax=Pseudogymnoascus destructans TaxID=655981 RepID=L8G8D5_PSED2|nr:uncharacterized protein VC83_08375 [Pseudogymnoascus destructans]ELR08281.1 hypothetical protein GMDG_03079 [Pseudogymnoascus destructans 20631-21]OAF55486.1 hypothetical protein VC83_08375 [Pseudogymnoascus destructans]